MTTPFVQLLYFCLRKKKRAHINIDFMLFYQRTDGATKHQMRLKSSFFCSANSYRFQWSTQPSPWSNGRLTLSPCDRFILPLILMPWGLCARNVKLNINLGVWRGCGNATANGSSKIEIGQLFSPLPLSLPFPRPLSPLFCFFQLASLSRYFLLKSWLVMETTIFLNPAEVK